MSGPWRRPMFNFADRAETASLIQNKPYSVLVLYGPGVTDFSKRIEPLIMPAQFSGNHLSGTTGKASCCGW